MRLPILSALIGVLASCIAAHGARADFKSTGELMKVVGFDSMIYNAFEDIENEKYGEAVYWLTNARSASRNTEAGNTVNEAINALTNSFQEHGQKWPHPIDNVVLVARAYMQASLRINRYVMRDTSPGDAKLVSDLVLKALYPDVDTRGQVEVKVVHEGQDRFACSGSTSTSIRLAGKTMNEKREKESVSSRGLSMLMSAIQDPRAMKYDPDVAALVNGQKPNGGDGDDQIVVCLTVGSFSLPARQGDPDRVKKLDLIGLFAGMTSDDGDVHAVPELHADNSVSFKIEMKSLKSLPAAITWIRRIAGTLAYHKMLLGPAANGIAKIIAFWGRSQYGVFRFASRGMRGAGNWLSRAARNYTKGPYSQSYDGYADDFGQMANDMPNPEQLVARIKKVKNLSGAAVESDPDVVALRGAVERARASEGFKLLEGNEAAQAELESWSARAAVGMDMAGASAMWMMVGASAALVLYHSFHWYEEASRTQDPDQRREIMDEYASQIAECPLFAIPIVGWGAILWDVGIGAWNSYAEMNGGTTRHWLFSDMLRTKIDAFYEQWIEPGVGVGEIMESLRNRLGLPDVLKTHALDPRTLEFQSALKAAQDKRSTPCDLLWKRQTFSAQLQGTARGYLVFLAVGRERFGHRSDDYYLFEDELRKALFESGPGLLTADTELLVEADRYLAQKGHLCAQPLLHVALSAR